MTQPVPFETYQSSDVDGSAMLVVDGTIADLTGWTAELRDDRHGTVTVTGFESRNAPRLDDGTVSVNPYVHGEWVPCWQVCVMGSTVVAFIDPDGVRY